MAVRRAWRGGRWPRRPPSGRAWNQWITIPLQPTVRTWPRARGRKAGQRCHAACRPPALSRTTPGHPPRSRSAPGVPRFAPPVRTCLPPQKLGNGRGRPQGGCQSPPPVARSPRAAHGSSKRRQVSATLDRRNGALPGQGLRHAGDGGGHLGQLSAQPHPDRTDAQEAPRRVSLAASRTVVAQRQSGSRTLSPRIGGSWKDPPATARRCRYPCTFPPATESAVPPRALPALPSLRFLTRPRASRSGEGRSNPHFILHAQFRRATRRRKRHPMPTKQACSPYPRTSRPRFPAPNNPCSTIFRSPAAIGPPRSSTDAKSPMRRVRQSFRWWRWPRRAPCPLHPATPPRSGAGPSRQRPSRPSTSAMPGVNPVVLRQAPRVGVGIALDQSPRAEQLRLRGRSPSPASSSAAPEPAFDMRHLLRVAQGPRAASAVSPPSR